MKTPTPAATLLLALAAGLSARAQALDWDGGASGTGNSLVVLANWNPDLADVSELTGKVLRVATSNNASPGSGSVGIGNILVGGTVTIAGFEFDNSDSKYRTDLGIRIVPTTSTTLTTDRVINFAAPGVIVSAKNNANASIRRFATNVGTGGDVATLLVNLDYEGMGVIDVDATSGFRIDEIKIAGAGGIEKTGEGTLTLVAGNLGDFDLAINTQYGTSTANTFSGGLTISGGVVAIDSTTRLGSAAAANTNAIVLANGTLRLTAGSTYLNNINRGTRVGNQTSVIEVTSANGGLRMQGSIRDIADQNGTLTKAGAGNLSLEGPTHSYTGGTVVRAGTLTINGGVYGDTGSVAGLSLESGVLLRGGGAFNGPSTIGDGSTVNIATYSSNAQTVAVGTLAFNHDLELDDATLLYDLDTPASSDLVTVGGVLDVGEGTLDLNSFTFTPGAGFAPGVYPLITADSPVVGTLGPVLTGTLGGQDIVLRLSGDGRSLQLAVGVVATPLETWRQTRFGSPENTGEGSDSADPDFDGLANLLEYALGGDPFVTDTALSPRLATASGHLTLAFSRIADPALIYKVVASDSLVADDWDTIWTNPDSVAETTVVTDPEPLSAHPRRFLRLNVSY